MDLIRSKEIKMVQLSEIKLNPKNRNKHPKEQIDELVHIIKSTGFRRPVTISNLSGYLSCGEGRYLAAKKIGLKEIPAMFQDYEDEAQEYADGIADNAIDKWAALDLSSINNDIGDLGPDFDIRLMGIKDFEIEVADKYDEETEDEVPEHVEPKAKLGDIYKLGNHRLMCGDSTSIDAVEKLMNGEKADMVFTDPPYNQTTSGGKNGILAKALRKQGSEIDHMCDFDPDEFLNVVSTVFSSGNMNALIFCNKDLVVDYLKWSVDSGYSYNILVWKKPNAIPIGNSYRPDIEYLLAFRKSGIWNGAIEECNYSKVLEHSRVKEKVHPTMKPVEMIENQIKILSNSGSAVLDLFGGSGSTLIACEKTSRRCFMMELDPHYIDVIISRWEKYTGQTAELINGQA